MIGDGGVLGEIEIEFLGREVSVGACHAALAAGLDRTASRWRRIVGGVLVGVAKDGHVECGVDEVVDGPPPRSAGTAWP